MPSQALALLAAKVAILVQAHGALDIGISIAADEIRKLHAVERGADAADVGRGHGDQRLVEGKDVVTRASPTFQRVL